MIEQEIKLVITNVQSTFVGEVMGLPSMPPYSQSYDEANRARYLAEDRINAARSSSSSNVTQVAKEAEARRAAESKVVHLKNVLRLIREYHVHSLPSAASSAEDLCCEWCRQIDEALGL